MGRSTTAIKVVGLPLGVRETCVPSEGTAFPCWVKWELDTNLPAKEQRQSKSPGVQRGIRIPRVITRIMI